MDGCNRVQEKKVCPRSRAHSRGEKMKLIDYSDTDHAHRSVSTVHRYVSFVSFVGG